MNVLLRKLEGWEKLTEADRQVLDQVIAKSHRVEAHQDLVREGDSPNNVHLILEGFACRYKNLADGRRQILAYLVPGDFCDLHAIILKTMDHSIATLSACVVVGIPRNTVLDLTENHPRISRALMWATLVAESVLREWIVNVGQRNAHEAIAHLLCEVLVRLEAVGLVRDGEYDLPLSQTELADTLGISIVHVNRTLKDLRKQGLVQIRDRIVHIDDVARLKAYAGFRPNYLHYGPDRR